VFWSTVTADIGRWPNARN